MGTVLGKAGMKQCLVTENSFRVQRIENGHYTIITCKRLKGAENSFGQHKYKNGFVKIIVNEITITYNRLRTVSKTSKNRN